MPLSKTFLQDMARYNGFALDDERIEALLPLLERAYPARARFRALDVGDVEPAPVFRPKGDAE